MDRSSLEALRRQFPDLDANGWSELGEGYGSSVFEHREVDIVVRIARSAVAGRRMSVVLPCLEWIADALPVEVPRPIWLIEPAHDAELPFGAFAYRKLAGEVLTPETVTDGTVESLTAVLIALHGLPTPDTRLGHPGISLLKPDEFHRARRNQYRAIRGLLQGRLTRSEFDHIEHWQERPVPEAARMTVVHGDFWHENVLIDAETGRVTGVLDWENLAIGDPAQDLVPLRYLGADIADRVLLGYLAAVDEDPDDFARRMTWWWENRDFSGIYLAMEMHDEPEITDGLRKLREGPILHSDGVDCESDVGSSPCG